MSRERTPWEGAGLFQLYPPSFTAPGERVPRWMMRRGLDYSARWYRRGYRLGWVLGIVWRVFR